MKKMIKLDKINIGEALRYMGAADAKDPVLTKKVEDTAAELLKIIQPVYTHKIFPIEFTDNGILLSGTSLVLTGKSAREHFSGCHSVILMAATLSGFADRYISTAEISDMAKALIADSFLAAARGVGFCNSFVMGIW